MGRGGKSSWGKGGKGRKAPGQSDEAKAKNAEYLQAVDARWNLVKGSLRPYASMSGSPFYAPASQSDADYLSLTNIAQRMETHTSEVVNRLGIALSEAGGTMTMGHELLSRYGTDAAQAGEKLGFAAMLDLLESEKGKRFVEAAAVLNKHNETAGKDAKALETAAANWVEFLLEDTKGKAKAAQRLAKAAAKSYLLSMELLQWLAAAKNLTAWAQKVKATKTLQPEKVQKWLRAPTDKKKLVAALVAAHQAQIEIQHKRGDALSDSEGASSAKSAGGGGDASSSESGGAGSSSTEKVKKKTKKDKKDKKAKKGDKKDKKRKEKKTANKEKKDRKKTKKSSSSNPSSSPEGQDESGSPSTRRRRKAESIPPKDEEKKDGKKKDDKEPDEIS